MCMEIRDCIWGHVIVYETRDCIWGHVIVYVRHKNHVKCLIYFAFYKSLHYIYLAFGGG